MDEWGLLRASARDLLLEAWGSAVAADRGDLAAVWDAAANLGWMGLAAEPAAVLVLAEVCGAAACPLPVVDTAIAAELFPDFADRIATGGLRPVVATGPAPLTVDAAAADAVVVLEADIARLHELRAWRPRSGMARPNWGEPELGAVLDETTLAAERRRSVGRALQLALAVRAFGAIAATAEEARAHAVDRRQFGRPVGAFGAVQQRIAATHIELAGLRLLVQAAEDAESATLAIVALQDRLPTLLFAGHHTLAASGYFEEHPAPWRFRRAVADLARSRQAGDAATEAVASLLERGLPNPGESAVATQLRAEVRATLAAQSDPGILRERAAALGWFSHGWPARLGGRDASLAEQAVVSEELRYARAPLDRQLTAQFLIGSSLVRHGSGEQQSDLLPLIARGELLVALGYSEAEAGSDLASLRTRAVRDGDAWVIDGEKLWSTYADTSTHYWLAARTDPGAERPQAGITVFLLPMDTPGITVRPLTALSGSRSAIVELRGVRVPDRARVGPLHGGWRVITDALAGERADMGGVAAGIHRALDDLCDALRGRDAAEWASWGPRLAAFAARVQTARVFARSAVAGAGDMVVDPLVAPSSAVFAGELAEEFGMFAVEVLGSHALLDDGPAAGAFDRALRLAPMYVIGGGTNDVLRGLIARGLGLPRE